SEKTFEEIVKSKGLTVLGWRTVPTDNSSLGQTAIKSEPCVRQVFIARCDKCATDQDFERKLFIIAKQAHNELRASGKDNFYYASSLSCRTIIYKGMLMPEQVGKYFPDLNDPTMDTALALVHSRFSTNTFPSWERAHPYHYIAHNGEINTLKGNVNWMKAREPLLASPLFGKDIEKIKPIVNTNGSDSAQFDNVLELLVMSGRSLPQAMMMMIPEPWNGHESMSEQKKAFYEYNSCLMEPWDGPASVVFTDGTMIGATLDRNGLRPSRFYVTKDDLVIMASEAGVLPVPPENVARKGRLQPGRMFLVDMEKGRIVADEEIKQQIASEKPYRQWLNGNLVKLADIAKPKQVYGPDHETILQRQLAFGYSFEDQRKLLLPMAKDGVEATGSMGTDIPLAVLSNKSKLLYDYFKQLFAQVTNPPIDCIREEIVTSSVTTIGPERNLLDPNPESCHLIELPTPILTNEELAKLREVAHGQFRSVTIPTLFNPKAGAKGLEDALNELFRQASLHIDAGINLIILSDRGVDRNNAAIPALLAVSGLHHFLIREGKRTKVGLILESGEPREVHHFCTLIGYGCGAINPYLAFETLDDMIRENLLEGVDHYTACKNYVKAATKGIVKVASKIGISTIQSYLGAQIFECVGLQQKVVDQYFTGTATR
ncbi:glutamate synthase subunit alpha, partial [bacterium]|nr:glutamate synthase subunit alpha [bacterium]